MVAGWPTFTQATARLLAATAAPAAITVTGRIRARNPSVNQICWSAICIDFSNSVSPICSRFSTSSTPAYTAEIPTNSKKCVR